MKADEILQSILLVQYLTVSIEWQLELIAESPEEMQHQLVVLGSLNLGLERNEVTMIHEIKLKLET